MPDAFIFNRTLLKRHLRRAQPHWHTHDFLHRHMTETALERLADIRRAFSHALLLGARDGHPAELLKDRVERVTDARVLAGGDILVDEEALPFAPERFDLALAVGNLHWINDLPGVLTQIRRALAPDGLFIGVFPGGDTLSELRAALMQAELETESGASPRVIPFLDIRDAGALLQRAGFALPVADRERLDVSYETPLALMKDLRGMGESNALAARPRPLARRTLAALDHLYPRDAEGRIAATFDILTLTGWAPHASQQKPLRRGSGSVHLGDALN